jgi:hypothetical protein
MTQTLSCDTLKLIGTFLATATPSPLLDSTDPTSASLNKFRLFSHTKEALTLPLSPLFPPSSRTHFHTLPCLHYAPSSSPGSNSSQIISLQNNTVFEFKFYCTHRLSVTATTQKIFNNSSTLLLQMAQRTVLRLSKSDSSTVTPTTVDKPQGFTLLQRNSPLLLPPGLNSLITPTSQLSESTSLVSQSTRMKLMPSSTSFEAPPTIPLRLTPRNMCPLSSLASAEQPYPTPPLKDCILWGPLRH